MNKLSQNINLKQGQTLVMNQQMQQAIKLLQLSNLELHEYLDEALETNPLLEKVDNKDAHDSISDGGAADNDSMDDNFAQDDWKSESGSSSDSAAEPPAQDDAPSAATETQDFDAGAEAMGSGSGGSHQFDDAEYSFENRLSREPSLREHLMDQLHILTEDARDRLIGALLIDQLDEAGYLRADPEDLAERLDCSEERIIKLLIKMKHFDPPGVFARDLADCLAMQLDEAGQLDAPMLRLLDNLDLLAAREWDKLVKACDVNRKYLDDMIDEIKHMQPKPASEFDHFVVQTVVPEVLMKARPKSVGGGWRVELNNATLPRVLVNQEYYTEVASKASRKEDKEFLSTQMQSANWLVRALDQRAQTILKVASEIIEQQSAFFLYGIEFLQPMNLKDIAEEIKMHESTVSRVTTNKYIGTPRGIFELKYFFSTALIGADGMVHSAESVKSKIKTMIDDEDANAVLSDDKIVDKLREDRIDIARRTVAKYREAMHIPSSVQRRKMKKE
jgi:RNA polymerase sigma-54 factor